MADYIDNMKKYCIFAAYAYAFFIYGNMLNETSEYIFFISFLIIPITTHFLFGSFLLGFFIQIILFVNCNPYELSHDTKLSTLEHISSKYVPSQQNLLSNVNPKKIKFPVILKPTVCTGDSRGIYIAHNIDEFNDFCKTINKNEYMIQSFLKDHNIEMTVLFEKFPWNKTGNIINITELGIDKKKKFVSI